MKKYRLTESRLRGIIREAVKRAINENYNEEGTDYGWGSDPDKEFVVQCGDTLQSLRKLYGKAQYVDKNLTGDILWCIERIHDAMMRIRDRRRN